MRIEVFTLCDAAADYHGKMSLLGTFDTIRTKKMPAIHPQCAIALRLRFSWLEQGDHAISIKLVDEDGKQIIPSLNANAKVRFSETMQGSIATNMILNLYRLKFEHYGEYSIDLIIDENEEAFLPLYVKEPLKES
ncbi:MAG: hypothetical protein SVY53_15020 [Chloroflexota bacterium]|nr:hypothetical protein [Chloroflexota bacterium]